ncbi:MAG: hypothetical protein QOI69_3520, partial [Pseudonocardiales bacterium]|nr:hypothetical protein [Pseudonocardiales bacterium]
MTVTDLVSPSHARLVDLCVD